MKTLLCGAAALLLLSTGCGSNNNVVGPGSDGGDGGPVGDGGPNFDAGGCYANPKTSYEIINACTDAGYVDKLPTLPLLQADGGLPPLP